MSKNLLTKIITELVNRQAKAMEYGVSLINIPEFDYVGFVQGLKSSRSLELFFLGFSNKSQVELEKSLPSLEKVSYSYTVEAAESSRNSGDEDTFRILVVKCAELEKLSSLRWFNEISLKALYAYSCKYVKDTLKKVVNRVTSSTFVLLVQISLRWEKLDIKQIL